MSDKPQRGELRERAGKQASRATSTTAGRRRYRKLLKLRQKMLGSPTDAAPARRDAATRGELRSQARHKPRIRTANVKISLSLADVTSAAAAAAAAVAADAHLAACFSFCFFCLSGEVQGGGEGDK